jgi:hypothetical protein
VECRLIGLGRAECSIEEVRGCERAPGPFDLSGAHEAVAVGNRDVTHAHPGQLRKPRPRMDDGPHTDPAAVTDNRALQHDHPGGDIAVGPDMAARQRVVICDAEP